MNRFLLASWIAFCAAPLMAQEKLFFDAVEIRLTSLEVVVTDAEGQPILDLAAGDFTILEGGEAQPLTHFSLQVEGETLAELQSEEAEATPAPRTTENLHLAIFVDDSHLNVGNRNRVFARLKEALDKVLRPGDQVMIARLSQKLEIVQPFTTDTPAVVAALDQLAEKASASISEEATYRRILRDILNTSVAAEDSQPEAGGASQRKIQPADLVEISARSQAREVLAFAEERFYRTKQTIGALGVAVDSLAGLGGRKALIFLSDGLPIRPGESLAEVWREKYEMWARQAGHSEMLTELSALRGQALSAQDELNALADSAAASRVAFYVLSPGNPLASGHVSAEYSSAPSDGGGGIRTAAAVEAFGSEGALLELAEKTGGIARTRSLQVEGLLQEIRRDFSVFYSLAYRPKAAVDPKNNTLEVKVARRGAKVRHAKRAPIDDPAEQLRALTLSTLYHGLGENPLEVKVVPKNSRKTARNEFLVEVWVEIPFEKLLLLPQENHHLGQVSLYVVAQDLKSQEPSSMQRIEIPIKIPNDAFPGVLLQRATYPLRLEMSKGTQRLAIGVRDQLARVHASVSVEIDAQSLPLANDQASPSAGPGR